MSRSVGVSREATEDLDRYWILLRRWNAAIRLVAPTSDEEGWRRHIEDSIQLADHLPPRSIIHCDLGSGGGLPGIPIGLLRRNLGFQDELTMIEADGRKAAFLRTAARELSLGARIVVERVEDASPCGADVVTARALAPLDRLLDYVARHLSAGGRAVLAKGRRADDEVDLARQHWAFDLDRHRSRTAPDASILVISNVKRLRGDDVR